MTNEDSLKQLSEAIDTYASAKVANNESLVKFAIANLQQFLNTHNITPNETTVESEETTEN